MKRWIFLAAASALTISAQAQLMLKNNQKDTVLVALAQRFDAPDFKGWATKGWYKLNPGDSGSIGPLMGGSIYYFLQTTSRKSSVGTRPFLVDPKNPFEVKDPESKSYQETHPHLEWRKFYEVKIPEKASKDGKLMIIL